MCVFNRFARGNRSVHPAARAAFSPSSSSDTTNGAPAHRADIEDGKDVGMSQRGSGSASCSNRRRRSASLEISRGQDFDGHVAPKPRIPGAIHLSHAARADDAPRFRTRRDVSRERDSFLHLFRGAMAAELVEEIEDEHGFVLLHRRVILDSRPRRIVCRQDEDRGRGLAAEAG
jgi:hypothetical protein